MPDTHVALQTLHMLLAEDIAHESLALTQTETPAVTGHDARSVLTAVLQHRQCVVYVRGDIIARHDSNQATHPVLPLTQVVIRSPGRVFENTACTQSASIFKWGISTD